jgi:hypothetical protein
MPHSSSLGRELFELRFDIERPFQRITSLLPGTRKIVLFTVSKSSNKTKWLGAAKQWSDVSSKSTMLMIRENKIAQQKGKAWKESVGAKQKATG